MLSGKRRHTLYLGVEVLFRSSSRDSIQHGECLNERVKG